MDRPRNRSPGYTPHMRRRKTQAWRSAVEALDQAQMILGSFEVYAENHPELVEEWAATISNYGTEADGWAFVCRDSGDSSLKPLLVPYVMVVTPIGLMFLEPADGHVVRGLTWPYFCYFDFHQSDIVQIRFFWYAGNGIKIEERLKNPSPITRGECEGWGLISDAAEPLVECICRVRHHRGRPSRQILTYQRPNYG